MVQRVYLETSVVSYLAALPSRDLIVAGHQQVTRDWWDSRDRFELFVSEAVLQEVSRGDVDAVARRTQILEGIAVLTSNPESLSLAKRFITASAMPSTAAIDALHVALAAAHAMEYLLTWNCKHIANATLRPQLEELCWRAGLRPPVICTPLELMEESDP